MGENKHMMLTGKSKEDFEKWYLKSKSHYDKLTVLDTGKINQMYKLDNSCIYALIIEWFDSVGVHILFDYWHNEEAWFSNIYHSKNMNMCINIKNQSRQEASKQAIIKANEIYNESKD